MTVSLIRCLLAVLALNEAYERVASEDVAHLLGLRKPTVHNMLAALQEKGLIDKERYGDVRLTDEGMELARRLEQQRDDLSLAFVRMGLDHDEALKAALLIMSGLSQESIDRLSRAGSPAQA